MVPFTNLAKLERKLFKRRFSIVYKHVEFYVRRGCMIVNVHEKQFGNDETKALQRSGL